MAAVSVVRFFAAVLKSREQAEGLFGAAPKPSQMPRWANDCLAKERGLGRAGGMPRALAAGSLRLSRRILGEAGNVSPNAEHLEPTSLRLQSLPKKSLLAGWEQAGCQVSTPPHTDLFACLNAQG